MKIVNSTFTPQPKAIGFKIRRKSDGLFSTGGRYVSWSKHGKVWSSIGTMKASIRLSTKSRFAPQAYQDDDVYEIVSVIESYGETKPLKDLLDEMGTK